MAHVIVVGNEKGGAGKSTVSMHVATALARMGHKVNALDLDLRQQTFNRYCINRKKYLESAGLALPGPNFHKIPETATPADLDLGMEASEEHLKGALNEISRDCEFIVIDCPGSHTWMSQIAHSKAHTLITPLNDSFVDFDLLAHTDTDGSTVLGPSIYSEMVWTARQRRAAEGMKPIDWVVLRNRLGAQQMHNKEKMGSALENLSKRIGFRIAPGFNERVIFREMFPSGLTLLDMKDAGINRMSMSNITARQELRDLIKSLELPDVVVNF
ncbi:MAG: AAA family ATPase [Roseovarius sp.]|nr:AAA family ATPase [Roseovarius sp.]MCY4290776.1 AAA family ATPase [Roseovarius sp.]MCY4315718.1 AAA family ATPase [Roseovarius sp.]